MVGGTARWSRLALCPSGAEWAALRAAYGHGSGDYGIAVGTRAGAGMVEDAALNPLFAAVLDAVEEAVLNSLFTATTTTGPEGRTLHAIPLPRLTDLLGR